MNRTTMTLLAASLLCGANVPAMSQQAQNENCARLQQLAEDMSQTAPTSQDRAEMLRLSDLLQRVPDLPKALRDLLVDRAEGNPL